MFVTFRTFQASIDPRMLCLPLLMVGWHFSFQLCLSIYKNNAGISESIFEESFKTNQNKKEEAHCEAEGAPHGSNGFTDFVNNVKVKTMEVVHNISNFIQDTFVTKNDADSAEAGSSSGFQSFFTQNTFFGLAIAVILIILLKRA
jgi:hypothetical protein